MRAVLISEWGGPDVLQLVDDQPEPEPGPEVAGTLDDGTRVVAMPHHGGYAEVAIADEQSIFRLPDGLGDHEALALLVQGLTAWHLYRTAAQVRDGETVVVHSAAGGTGSLAVPPAQPTGAGRGIASPSSEDKPPRPKGRGADAALDRAPADMTPPPLAAHGGHPAAR